MLRDSSIKGFLLGIVTGLLVTFFDSLVIVKQPVYVPPLFPFALIMFNSLFWALLGSLSGLFLGMLKDEKSIQDKEAYYWVLFFLMPFVVVYGLLGRIPTPPATVTHRPFRPVFDHHLSFIWAALVLFFALFYSKRKETAEPFSPLTLSLELVTVIGIFHFCSDPGYIRKLSFMLPLPTHQFLGIPPEYRMVSSYALGVVFIGGFYFSTFFLVRPFIKKILMRYEYGFTALLFFSVSAWLAGSIILNHSKVTVTREMPLTAAGAGNKELAVPYCILIVLDTLRADRLSLYNDTLETSKNLEIFAKDSLVFDQCITPSPWTLPAHASLFTGLYVSEHRCEYLISPLPILSRSSSTLAELFGANGYKTAAIVANFGWLHPKFNVDQGFQIYNCFPSSGFYNAQPFRPVLFVFSYLTHRCSKILSPYISAEDINREAFKLLDALQPAPFFLFLNYMDAHTPYRPPRPFDQLFLDKQFPQVYRLKQYMLRLLGKHDKTVWDSYLLSQYDGEIAYLDAQLGALLAKLKAMGIYDSSLIVVTSDHGELLGEHGLYEHHADMYEGVLRVPLIVKYPYSKRIGREKRLINLADVFTTVLSGCDLPLPAAHPGAKREATSSAVAELYSFVLGEHRALYQGNYKYMEYRDIDSKELRRAELYDVVRDPHERENLLEKYPAVASAMQKRLREWEQVHAAGEVVPEKSREPLSRELQENLKALGYVVSQ